MKILTWIFTFCITVFTYLSLVVILNDKYMFYPQLNFKYYEIIKELNLYFTVDLSFLKPIVKTYDSSIISNINLSNLSISQINPFTHQLYNTIIQGFVIITSTYLILRIFINLSKKIVWIIISILALTFIISKIAPFL